MYTKSKETHDFLVPDYFFDFNCKMGACRNACCQGWPVTFSMQNYFSLLGIECSKELRDRLDRSLKILERPTEEEYAFLSHNYEGNCSIRMGDGRCPIHAHLGEEYLPDVCRLFPRGFRLDEGKYEVSLSNSCEAVGEIFYCKKDPIRFSEKSMCVALPTLGKRHTHFETQGHSREIRLFLISIVQNRSFSLPVRLLQLGSILKSIESILSQKDEIKLKMLLRSKNDKLISFDPRLTKEDLTEGLEIAKKAINIIDKHSNSIKDYGTRALEFFSNDSDSFSLYFDAKKVIEEAFPDLEIFFEHLLVNHMFFSLFPFQDRPDTLYQEFVTICAVYTLLRFLVIGNCGEKFDKNTLIDTASAFFRHVSHTDFERFVSKLLFDSGCHDIESLKKLLKL